MEGKNYFIKIKEKLTKKETLSSLAIFTLIVLSAISKNFYWSAFVLALTITFCYWYIKDSIKDIKISLKKGEYTWWRVIAFLSLISITIGGIILLFIDMNLGTILFLILLTLMIIRFIYLFLTGVKDMTSLIICYLLIVLIIIGLTGILLAYLDYNEKGYLKYGNCDNTTDYKNDTPRPKGRGILMRAKHEALPDVQKTNHVGFQQCNA